MNGVKPFMVYMGGKRGLLKDIKPNVPLDYGNYHEPFLGGGAVALAELEEHDRNPLRPDRKFFLSDYSTNVVAAWTAVKDHPEELIALLKVMLDNHCRENFREIRDWDRDGVIDSKSALEVGARLIYLLQTCFGGKIESTKAGYLDVSYRWGTHYKAGHGTYDYDNLRRVSELLNKYGVTIARTSYEVVLGNSSYGDFAYMDPPYEPTADTGETLTTNYTGTLISQEGIRKVIDALTTAGVSVLMSNSDTAVLRALYEGWAVSRPHCRWGIGTSTGKAKLGQEILVANWRLADRLRSELVLAS